MAPEEQRTDRRRLSWHMRVNGKDYPYSMGMFPFHTGIGTVLDLTYPLQTHNGSRVGKYRVAYVFKNVAAIDPKDPTRIVHFDELATEEVEFEVVAKLPAGYIQSVFEPGWDRTLEEKLTFGFGDLLFQVASDYKKDTPRLLRVLIDSVSFDLAFEVYAEPEGGKRQRVGTCAVRANQIPGVETFGDDRLTWENAKDRRWRLHLVPSADVAQENPPIRRFYAREFTTDWQSFTPGPRFDKLMERRKAYLSTRKAEVDRLLEKVGWGGEGRRESEAAQAAVVAMGSDVVPVLLPKLSSPDARIRRCVAQILLDIQPVAEPTLLAVAALASDKDEYVPRAVCDKLAAMGPTAAAAVPVIEKASDRDAFAAISRWNALARITGKTGLYVPRIAGYLDSKEPDAVYSAASYLGELGPAARGEWPKLLVLARNAKSKARGQAIATLGEIGADEEPVIDGLIDALKNAPEHEFRRAAAGALGKFGPKSRRAVPALGAVFAGERDASGWWIVARALGRIGGAEVVPFLVKAADSEVRDTRVTATGQIALLAEKLPVARQALEGLTKSRHADVRNTAAFALKTPNLAPAPADTPWGEAVEGVQVRLRADKVQWKAGETPTFKAEFRNDGKRELGIPRQQELAQVEFDGTWYYWFGVINIRTPICPPGTHVKDMVLSLGEPWRSSGENKPLNLAPGKHTVRIALPTQTREGREKFRFESNPVEIEILAGKRGNAPLIELEDDWPKGKVVDRRGDSPPEPAKRVAVSVKRPQLKITGLDFISRKGHPRVDVRFQFEDGKTVGGALFELTLLDRQGAELGTERVLELRNQELPVQQSGATKYGGPDPPNRSGKAELRFLNIDLAAQSVARYRLRVVDADVPLLIALLEEPDAYVRESAVKGLGQLGAAAKTAVPFLEKRLRDQEERVRDAAQEALDRIREETTAWGEAVEGVQVRLRADKVQWKPGEMPTFKAEVKNEGKRDLSIAQAQELAELEVDGTWYRWAGEVDVKSSTFGPGMPWKHFKDISFTLVEFWQSKVGAKPLGLAPGKHTVRVAFIAKSMEDVTGLAPKPVRAVSNLVEIEVLPNEEAKDAADVVQRYMTAVLARDMDALDALAVGPPENVVEEELAKTPARLLSGYNRERRQSFVRELHREAAQHLDELKPVGEVALKEDFGAVRLASVGNISDIWFLVQRTPKGWRVLDIFNTSRNTPAGKALESGRNRYRTAARWLSAPRGEAVRGLQVQLAAASETWPAGKPPRLDVSVRITGKEHLERPRAAAPLEIEFDGAVYRNAGTAIAVWNPIWPEEMTLTLDGNWRRGTDGTPLAVTPGKHTVRVAAFAVPADGGTEKPGDEPIRAVSNPVEIEILAADAEPDAAGPKDLLPGSQLSIEDAIKNGFAFIALCEATDKADIFDRVTGEHRGYASSHQSLKVLETLAGQAPPEGVRGFQYTSFDIPTCRERDIRQGERVIWVVRNVGDRFRGIKALPDTPENRAAVKEAIAKASPWGEAVEGVQVRLRADKVQWKAGETPTFKIDVRNGGKLEVLPEMYEYVNCRVEVDETPYVGAIGYPRSLAPLKPANLAADIVLKLNGSFLAERGDQPLRMGAGKHTVRVGFQFKSTGAVDADPWFRVTSNPVEIEILAAEGAAGKARLGFLADLPEFYELDLTVTEETLKRIIAEKGLRNICTWDDKAKTWHVYRRDGENVIVTFRDGKCSGVQRMRKDASYADKLFDGLGKLAESLQVRLRAEKKVWKAGEDLVLKADVTNVGKEDVAIARDGNNYWAIEMDGQWYGSETDSLGFPNVLLAPGEVAKDISVPPAWTRPLQWRARREEGRGSRRGKLLTLEPGRHTIRVAVYPVMYSVDAEGRPLTLQDAPDKPRVVLTVQATPGKPVSAISNPVEIEILAAGVADAVNAAPVTKVYDIRDLLAEIPDSEGPRAFITLLSDAKEAHDTEPGGASSMASAADKIIAMIQGTVDAGSWPPEGKIGSIRFQGGQGALIVTQTAENHAAIAALISRLREKRSVLASVASTFIDVPADEDAKLRAWLADTLKRPFDEVTGQTLLSDADVAKLLQHPVAAARVRVIDAPKITTMNGQRAYLAVSEQSHRVLKRRARPDERVGVTFQQGCWLDSRATVAPDRKRATLTLRPRFVRLVSADPELHFTVAETTVNANVPDGLTLLLHIPVVEKTALVDDVRDPTGAVTGARVSIIPVQKDATVSAYVYLLVKPTILIQEEVEEEGDKPLPRAVNPE